MSAVIAAVVAAIRVPMFCNRWPNALIFARAALNPRTSLLLSAKSSTNARPARIALPDGITFYPANSH